MEDTLTESGGHPDGIGEEMMKRQQRAPPRDRNGGAIYQVHVHYEFMIGSDFQMRHL